MALDERDTTRFVSRVGRWFGKAVLHVAGVLEALLNFRAQDNLRDKGVKTTDFAVRRVLYLVVDNWLWALQASLAVALKNLDYPLFGMFLVLWAYDFATAGLFVVIYEVTGKDLSLGEDFRRAVNTIGEKSRLVGVIATAAVTLWALVWTGPEKVITFFRKEIGSVRRLVLLLAGLTAFQSFLWAALYSFAYDLVVKLL